MAMKDSAAAIGVVFIALLLGIAWKLSYADTLPSSTTAQSMDFRPMIRQTTFPTSTKSSPSRLSIQTSNGRP